MQEGERGEKKKAQIKKYEQKATASIYELHYRIFKMVVYLRLDCSNAVLLANRIKKCS